ncbi:MAG: dihydrolipoyl dehydrogenase [Candidatus Omnitrophota bacterium]|nr:MAG: dihydrolipoyl dehydrogenase [Candidatus Omnitrophota bacterium]
MAYDLIVIGAGWAGFNAAIAAQRKGLKVALIEQESLGGTCLNLGCIPTKVLIQSSKVLKGIKDASAFGVEIDGCPRVNFKAVLSRKDRIIEQLRKGIELRLKGVECFKSRAELVSPDTVKLKDKKLNGRTLLIACGSEPAECEGLKFDGKKIVSSNDILSYENIPASLLIVGGGVIGCEFASLFSLLGSRVTIREAMPQLLPQEDSEVARKLETSFKKRGIEVITQAGHGGYDLRAYETVLVCVGRKPRIFGLGLDSAGIKTDKGRIIVDEYLRTTVHNVYAAGDCTGINMLAHFAAYQARIAALNITVGLPSEKAANENVPNCIFTHPEVASVGLNEKTAKERSLHTEVRVFHFLGSAMARIMGETEGFIKIVTDTQSDRILGASIIGPCATELVGILTVAVQARVEAKHFRDLLFAHPSLSENTAESLRET